MCIFCLFLFLPSFRCFHKLFPNINRAPVLFSFYFLWSRFVSSLKVLHFIVVYRMHNIYVVITLCGCRLLVTLLLDLFILFYFRGERWMRQWAMSESKCDENETFTTTERKINQLFLLLSVATHTFPVRIQTYIHNICVYINKAPINAKNLICMFTLVMRCV